MNALNTSRFKISTSQHRQGSTLVKTTNLIDRWCWMNRHVIHQWRWWSKSYTVATLIITRYPCRTREIKCKGWLGCHQCSLGHTMTWIRRKLIRQRSAQMDLTVQRWVNLSKTGMVGTKVKLLVVGMDTQKKNEITSQYPMVVSTQRQTFSPYKTANRLAIWLLAMKTAMDSTKTPLITMNQIHTNSVRIRKGQILFSLLPRLPIILTSDLRHCNTSSFSQVRNFRIVWWRRNR